jgi:hypothetical protein
MAVSVALGRILAAGRSQFNARVAQARRHTPGFSDEDFAAFLHTGVDGIVAAVDRDASARSATVVLAAYEIALALCAQGLVGPGSRCPLVNQVWTELLPLLARQVAEAPKKVLGALSNAAVNLARTPGLRGQEWLDCMRSLAPEVGPVEDLLNLGKLLAWRCGAAHYRTGALAAADALPEKLALAAVGATAQHVWKNIRDQLHQDPWWMPTPSTAVQCWQVGAFSGFGGTFSEPPQLRAAPQGFWVKSGMRFSLLLADAWGALLLPATVEEFEAAPLPGKNSCVAVKGQRLVFSNRTLDLDLPRKGLAIVCNEHTAAVVSPYSHAISLYPLT